MKKQGFLYGSAVLMISAVLVKITGALFKIPLANMLGGTGMGYFSSAYSIFMPVYAVSVTGLPTAVARTSAAACITGREEDCTAVKREAMRLFALVGAAAMLVILLAAYPFCKYISKDIYALPAVAAIAPSVMAGCLVSVYRGYYEGMRNMYPTALSQLVEGVARLVMGLALCKLCLFAAEKYPEKFLRIIGCEGKNISAEAAAVPYSAAAAVLGITLSSFAGLFYLMKADARLSEKNVSKVKPSKSDRDRITGELLKIALPAAIGALVTNLTSLIDLVTIMQSLRTIIGKSPWVFAGLLGAGVSYAQIPNFVYGSFTGLAVTVFNLVPSLTNMFGKSMLPAAAAAKASGDEKRLGECAYGAMLASSIAAVPAGLGIAAMAEPILSTLFSGKTLEISVCADAMAILGLAVPFLCLSSAAFSLLQAADRADIPVKLMGIGAAVKLAGNLILTPVGSLGVTGAAISTLICYGVICIASLAELKKYAGFCPGKFFTSIIAVIVGGVLCAAGAVIMYDLICGRLGTPVSTVLSCGFGALIYIIVTYFSGIISKSTLKMLIS